MKCTYSINDTFWSRFMTIVLCLLSSTFSNKYLYIGSSITKKALRWTPQGCRDRGRPKNTWKRTVEKELGNMKLNWSEAESKAQDRAEWRSIVGGLCSGRSWKAKKKTAGLVLKPKEKSMWKQKLWLSGNFIQYCLPSVLEFADLPQVILSPFMLTQISTNVVKYRLL